ncbi:MAG: hypothetical protein ABIR70_15995 [Bryobacteraceae bacterium]
MKLFLVCGLFSLSLIGQDAAWENIPHAANLAAQAALLKPLLDQLKPEEWLAKGAPETYVTHLNGAQRELAALTASATELDRQPQKLTAALDTYFRLQALEWRFESLIAVVSKYQNPAIGDQLLSVLRGNAANRDGLRVYITELAARREQEFTIVNQDAQSCRTQLSQIPTAARRNAKGK